MKWRPNESLHATAPIGARKQWHLVLWVVLLSEVSQVGAAEFAAVMRQRLAWRNQTR